MIRNTDDTLVTARRVNFQEAVRLATRGLFLVVGCIKALDWRVALDNDGMDGWSVVQWATPLVNSVLVSTGSLQVRYLGLILGGSWFFDEHILQPVGHSRVGRAASRHPFLLTNADPFLAWFREEVLHSDPIRCQCIGRRMRANQFFMPPRGPGWAGTAFPSIRFSNRSREAVTSACVRVFKRRSWIPILKQAHQYGQMLGSGCFNRSSTRIPPV